jgi:transporter family protein
MYISPLSAVVFEVLGGMIVGACVLFFIGFRPEMDPRGVGLAMITGTLGFLGALCYLIAIRKGKVSVIVTLTALYPIVSILLAHFILHESITIKQVIGIIFACLAIGCFTI